MTTFIKMSDVNKRIEEAVKYMVKDKLKELQDKAVAELNQKFIEIALQAEKVLKIEMMQASHIGRTDIVVSVALLGVEE